MKRNVQERRVVVADGTVADGIDLVHERLQGITVLMHLHNEQIQEGVQV
jgi:hypothetical protein